MKKLVFTFGRMNPPTIGHEKLANKIKSVAKQEKADARIYLSHTQNPIKDPLSYKQKLTFAKKAFGIAHQSNAKQIFQIVKELYEEGYTDIVMVVGSDRVTEFKTILNKYNGKGDYDFDSIKVVSAGKRDPDAEGVEGMSGTKLRGLAKKGQFDDYTDEDGKKQFGFGSAAASKLSDRDKKKMMDMVGKALKEDLEFAEWTDEDALLYEEIETLDLTEAPLSTAQRKKRAQLMKRLAPKIARIRKQKAKRQAGAEQLKKRAQKQAIQIVRKKVAGEKGTRYKDLSPGEKQSVDKMVAKKSGMVQKIAKKLMPKVKKGEQERVKAARSKTESFELDNLIEEALIEVKQDTDIKDRDGTQPSKYFSGLAKSTKAKRNAAFKKQAKMDNDNPDAYKPAPGDASAKTKPSKYTKKYQQMFGEEIEGLKKKAEKSGISYGILKKVYDRGMAAWKSGHRPGTTPQQWAFARVNSFITGGKTRTTADADLWAKHSGKTDTSKINDEAVSPAQQAAIAIAKKKSGKYDKDGKRIDEEVGKYEKVGGKTYYAVVNKAGKKKLFSGPTPAAKKYANTNEAYEYGTDEYAKHTKDMTPGQADEMTVKDKKLKNLKIATGKSARQAKQTLARNKARKERRKGTALAAAYNPDDDFGGKPVKKFKDFKKKSPISEAIQYHLDTGVPFADNIFRHDSPSFYMFFQEARVRWRNGELEPDATDKQILMTDIGLFGIYEGKEVPLDCPLMEIEEGFVKDTAKLIKMIYKYDKSGKDADAFEAIKFGWDYIKNPKVKKMIVDLVKRVSTENGYPDWNVTVKYIKKNTGVDVSKINEINEADKDVELNSPKRGGSKKFYVYVKNDKGNVIKVEFGDTTGLKAKINDREAARNFAARHQCDTKNDKTKPGYWACRLPWYAKSLGLEGGGKYFW